MPFQSSRTEIWIMEQAKPDFIGFNYYNTATVEWDDSPVAVTDSEKISNQPVLSRGYTRLIQIQICFVPSLAGR